jgi:hypothetical protein
MASSSWDAPQNQLLMTDIKKEGYKGYEAKWLASVLMLRRGWVSECDVWLAAPMRKHQGCPSTITLVDDFDLLRPFYLLSTSPFVARKTLGALSSIRVVFFAFFYCFSSPSSTSPKGSQSRQAPLNPF